MVKVILVEMIKLTEAEMIRARGVETQMLVVTLLEEKTKVLGVEKASN